jgi:hypothetical protein
MAVATMDVSSIIKKMTSTNDTSTLSSVRPVRYDSSSFSGGESTCGESTCGSFSILVVDMLINDRKVLCVVVGENGVQGEVQGS